MRWGRHVARMGKEKHMQAAGGKSEGKRPLGRPKRGWKDTKLELKQDGTGVD